jgi:hypothetical protein
MTGDSTPLPTLDELRALARVQGVEPTDADLEGVLGFLATVLPALREAGLYLPPEAT